MIWLATAFALASAATTALSTALQHHAAGDGSLGGMWRRPRWLLALGLAPLGFCWHVLALRSGPLSLVQPVVVVGVVAALPLRELMARARPRWHEVRTATWTVGALAVFLLATRPRPAVEPPDLTRLLLATAVAVAVAAVAATLAGAVRRPATRATALGLVAGILFGLMAVLVDATQLWLRTHPAGALALTWLPYALVACGVGGLAVNQLAYRAGPLAASMPLLNVASCLLAVAFGTTVLGEPVATSPVSLLVAAVCLVVVARGLWALHLLVVVIQLLLCDEPAPTRSRSGWA